MKIGEGTFLGTGKPPTKSLAHRRQPHRFCFGAESSGGEVGRRLADATKSILSISEAIQTNFQKSFGHVFCFPITPKFNMESEKNHLFNIFPIPQKWGSILVFEGKIQLLVCRLGGQAGYQRCWCSSHLSRCLDF